MQFIDFFAGIGGFRRGMELAGHECIGFCEFDKYAVASYTSMHLITDEQREYLATLDLKKRQKEILNEEYRNNEWYANDITGVMARDLPNRGGDCWCFGAPCQDFSVAGKRAGLEGNRSSLVGEIFRLLEEQPEEDRPEWLIYENVKGMLSSNNGLDFLYILSEMDRFGYDIEWQNLNSAWYVPQNRERIYTIGHLRRYGPAKVFPIQATDGKNSVSIIGHRDGYRRNTQTFSQDGITEALDTGQGGGRGHHVALPCFTDLTYGAGVNLTDKARTIQARYCKGASHHNGEVSGVAIPVLTPERANKRQNGRRFKEDGDPSFTLTAQDRHGVAVPVEPKVVLNVKEATKQGYAEAEEGDSINLTMPESKTRRGRVGKQIANTLDTQCNQGVFVKVSDELTVYAVWYEKYQCYIAIRKLTPKECFRLQGWTDDYFEKAAFVNSDSQLYKQAGNGVTVPVAEAVGNAINHSKDGES